MGLTSYSNERCDPIHNMPKTRDVYFEYDYLNCACFFNLKLYTMGKFVIKKRVNGEFQFDLKAGNGQVILTSEGYAGKSGCQNGIESVKANSINDAQYVRKTATNGKPFFNLKAKNGEVIGTSEMYESESARENGIDSVKKNAPEATVEDLS